MLLGFPSSSFLVQRPFSNGRKFLLEDALGTFIGLGLGSGPGLEPLPRRSSNRVDGVSVCLLFRHRTNPSTDLGACLSVSGPDWPRAFASASCRRCRRRRRFRRNRFDAFSATKLESKSTYKVSRYEYRNQALGIKKLSVLRSKGFSLS